MAEQSRYVKTSYGYLFGVYVSPRQPQIAVTNLSYYSSQNATFRRDGSLPHHDRVAVFVQVQAIDLLRARSVSSESLVSAHCELLSIQPFSGPISVRHPTDPERTADYEEAKTKHRNSRTGGLVGTR